MADVYALVRGGGGGGGVRSVVCSSVARTPPRRSPPPAVCAKGRTVESGGVRLRHRIAPSPTISRVTSRWIHPGGSPGGSPGDLACADSPSPLCATGHSPGSRATPPAERPTCARGPPLPGPPRAPPASALDAHTVIRRRLCLGRSLTAFREVEPRGLRPPLRLLVPGGERAGGERGGGELLSWWMRRAFSTRSSAPE